MRKARLVIGGMHCSGCAQFVARLLGAEGVVVHSVDRKTGVAYLSYDMEKISLEGLKKIIDDTGTYRLESAEEQQ